MNHLRLEDTSNLPLAILHPIILHILQRKMGKGSIILKMDSTSVTTESVKSLDIPNMRTVRGDGLRLILMLRREKDLQQQEKPVEDTEFLMNLRWYGCNKGRLELHQQREITGTMEVEVLVNMIDKIIKSLRRQELEATMVWAAM